MSLETIPVPKELIEEILEFHGECHHDHHGYCQEHNLHPRGECWIELLQKALDGK